MPQSVRAMWGAAGGIPWHELHPAGANAAVTVLPAVTFAIVHVLVVERRQPIHEAKA